MFQCVQRGSQITARAVLTVTRELAARVNVFPGEVAVAACVSATALALLNTRAVSDEESATAFVRVLPLFTNPPMLHIVPARALFAPGGIRAEVPAADAPGVDCPVAVTT